MFARSPRSRPSDQEIIRGLRTEVNRLVLALARAGVVDPQTGEERAAIEILKDARYWRDKAMELGHWVDRLEKERDEALRELGDLRAAQAGPEPDECAGCGSDKVVYQNAWGHDLCSACCEGCSSDCRERHTYEDGCALTPKVHTPRTYTDFSDSVTAAQREHDIYYCPTSGDEESASHGGFDTCCDRPDLHRPVESPSETTAELYVVKPLWAKGVKQP